LQSVRMEQRNNDRGAPAHDPSSPKRPRSPRIASPDPEHPGLLDAHAATSPQTNVEADGPPRGAHPSLRPLTPRAGRRFKGFDPGPPLSKSQHRCRKAQIGPLMPRKRDPWCSRPVPLGAACSSSRPTDAEWKR
jgi:hypothetical protein